MSTSSRPKRKNSIRIQNSQDKLTELNEILNKNENTDLLKEIIEAKNQIINEKERVILELQEKNILLRERICDTEKLLKEMESHKKEYNSKTIVSSSLSHNDEFSVYTKANNIIPKSKNDIACRENTKYGNTCMILNPKRKQDVNKTKKDMNEKINISQLKITLSKIQATKNGGLVISCDNEDEKIKLKKVTEETLGNDYEIMEPEEKRPMLKIVGMDDEYEERTFIDMIKRNNKCVTEDSEIKLITMKKMKTRYLAIIQCDKKTYYEILKTGMLCINYSICSVYEHYNVRRCYKCSGFQHSSEKCTRQQVCLKCGSSEHLAHENMCDPTFIMCPNCSEINVKFGLNLDTKHCPFDRNCPIFLRKIESEKNNCFI